MRLEDCSWPVESTRQYLVLNVNPDAETLQTDRELIEAHGARMISCLGPERANGCPMLEGGVCSRRTRADAIVLQLDLDSDDHVRLMERYLQLSDVPLLIVVGPDELARRWDELWRCLLSPRTTKHLLLHFGPPDGATMRALIAMIRPVGSGSSNAHEDWDRLAQTT